MTVMDIHCKRIVVRNTDEHFNSNIGIRTEENMALTKSGTYNNKISINIDRFRDIFVPRYVTSNKPLQKIEFVVGDCVIISFPCKFIVNLVDEVMNIPNKFVYKIPWKLFFNDELFVVSLQFHDIKFVMLAASSEVYDFSVTLYGTDIFVDTEYRQKIMKSFQEIKFKEIKYEENIKIQKECVCEIPLKICGLLKGFFINNINRNDIQYIEVFIDGQKFINCTTDLIYFFTEKISDKMTYICHLTINHGLMIHIIHQLIHII